MLGGDVSQQGSFARVEEEEELLRPPPRRTSLRARRESKDDERRSAVEAEVSHLLDLDRRNGEQLRDCYSLLKVKYEVVRRENSELQQQLRLATDRSALAEEACQKEIVALRDRLTAKVAALENASKVSEEGFEEFKSQLKSDLTSQFEGDAQVLEHKLATIESACDHLSLSNARLSNNLETAERELSSQETSRQRALEHAKNLWELERQSLLQRIEELSSSNNVQPDSAAQVEQLKDDALRQSELARELTSKLTLAERERDKLKLQKEDDATQIQELRSQLSVSREESVATGERLKAAEAELATALRSLARREAASEREAQKARLLSLALQSDLKAARETAASLRAEAERILPAEERRKAAAMSGELAAVKMQLEDAQKHLKEAKNAKTALDSSKSRLEFELQNATFALKEAGHIHKLQLQEKESAASRLGEQVERLTKKLAKEKRLRSEIERLTAEADERRRLNASVQGDLGSTRELQRQLREKDAAMKQEQRKYRDLLKEMKRKYQSLKSSHNSSPEKTLSKQSTVDSLKLVLSDSSS